MKATYYDFNDLVEKVKRNPSQENLNALGEWFSEYGMTCWNGECFDLEKELNANLYPIYKLVNEEFEEYELIGYELR